MRQVVLIAFIVSAVTIRAEVNQTERPTASAEQQYVAAMKKAQADYDAAVTIAREKFMDDLDKAMDAAMTAKDFPKAKQIDELKQAVQAQQKMQPIPVAPRNDGIEGWWRVTYIDRVVRVYEVDKNGHVNFPEQHREGKLEATPRGVMLNFKDDRLERWTRVRDFLLVEHFGPQDTKLARGKPGIGVRLERNVSPNEPWRQEPTGH